VVVLVVSEDEDEVETLEDDVDVVTLEGFELVDVEVVAELDDEVVVELVDVVVVVVDLLLEIVT
jgi:phosphoribosylaminoimidazole carboxylase (NCAIR synthetase)